MTPYRGKNFDPMYHIKKGLSKPTRRDPAPIPNPRKTYVPPAAPVPSRIVIVETGAVHDTYPTRAAASKALKQLIKGLPHGAPHTYEIEDDN